MRSRWSLFPSRFARTVVDPQSPQPCFLGMVTGAVAGEVGVLLPLFFRVEIFRFVGAHRSFPPPTLSIPARQLTTSSHKQASAHSSWGGSGRSSLRTVVRACHGQ